jgi:DNA polymerase
VTPHRITVAPEFEAWRDAARNALANGFLPEEIHFEDSTQPQVMALFMGEEVTPSGPSYATPHVPKEFLASAKIVACHRESSRWNLLYRILWRLQTERMLLKVEVDDDVAAMKRMESQVARDLHKMHAFVRFRKVEEPDGREHFVAWYKPDHRIVRLAAPFFAERFAVMFWTILTPDESMAWDPEARRLSYGAGVGKEAAPQEDELEGLWRSYYGSIFNPARLNPQAMRSEMPVRYWSNLPELAALPQMMQRAEARVATMVSRQKEQPTAAPFVPAEHKLPVLREAMHTCKGCELYKFATQVVPGAGATHAKLLLVGEQPGDQEDLQGAPFVGPAGNILRKVIEELGVEGKDIYMTNAVKHFKFTQRGKLRLHQSPRMSEINACRPWLAAEIEAVKPRVILCLGASAAKSLLGGTFALMHDRGKILETPYSDHVMATVHPSAVLRARDEAGRQQLYGFLKDDLALAYATALGKHVRGL